MGKKGDAEKKSLKKSNRIQKDVFASSLNVAWYVSGCVCFFFFKNLLSLSNRYAYL